MTLVKMTIFQEITPEVVKLSLAPGNGGAAAGSPGAPSAGAAHAAPSNRRSI
jgi:hypothetical protein